VTASSTDPIDEYVETLRGRLRRVPWRRRRRILTEVREHLVQTSRAIEQTGSSQSEARQQAVSEFGGIDEVGAGFDRWTTRRGRWYWALMFAGAAALVGVFVASTERTQRVPVPHDGARLSAPDFAHINSVTYGDASCIRLWNAPQNAPVRSTVALGGEFVLPGHPPVSHAPGQELYANVSHSRRYCRVWVAYGRPHQARARFAAIFTLNEHPPADTQYRLREYGSASRLTYSRLIMNAVLGPGHETLAEQSQVILRNEVSAGGPPSHWPNKVSLTPIGTTAAIVRPHHQGCIQMKLASAWVSHVLVPWIHTTYHTKLHIIVWCQTTDVLNRLAETARNPSTVWISMLVWTWQRTPLSAWIKATRSSPDRWTIQLAAPHNAGAPETPIITRSGTLLGSGYCVAHGNAVCPGG
jgi:hypothetical protein